MPKDILNEYGKDTPNPQSARASCGGVTEAKPLPYSPPKGPIGLMEKGVGLHGTNHGYCGTQGKR